MKKRQIVLQLPTCMSACSVTPLPVQLIRNHPSIVLRTGQKWRMTKHAGERQGWRTAAWCASHSLIFQKRVVLLSSAGSRNRQVGQAGQQKKEADAKVSLKQIKYQKAAGSFETAWLLFWQRRKASH